MSLIELGINEPGTVSREPGSATVVRRQPARGRLWPLRAAPLTHSTPGAAHRPASETNGKGTATHDGLTPCSGLAAAGDRGKGGGDVHATGARRPGGGAVAAAVAGGGAAGGGAAGGAVGCGGHGLWQVQTLELAQVR